MKISIFGVGYVGAVSAACFSELGHEVVGVDVNEQKVAFLNEGRFPVVEAGVDERLGTGRREGRVRGTTDSEEAVLATEASLVCVGTPNNAAGELSLDAVQTVLARIGRAIRKKDGAHGVVVRSTLMPGTTEERLAPLLMEQSRREIDNGLRLGCNPEFLREGTGVRDFLAPPFILSGSVGAEGHRDVEVLYRGVDAPFVKTDCRTAESVKLLSNMFHAVKITFANEAGALLKALGVDAREAMRLFCEDRQLNISTAYLCPGFALGGSCLPKDVLAFQTLARDRHVNLPMLRNILPSNRAHADRAFDLVTRNGCHKVALFGLAFKPRTDDLRESPFVALAARLIDRGYGLAIFDESLHLGRLLGANRAYAEAKLPHLDRLYVPDPESCLDGAGSIVVGHASSAAIDVIARCHAGRPIVDLQGVRRLQDLDGVRYEGLCW